MSPMEQLFSLPCIPLPTFPQNKLGITQTNYVPNDPVKETAKNPRETLEALQTLVKSLVIFESAVSCFNPIHKSWAKM